MEILLLITQLNIEGGGYLAFEHWDFDSGWKWDLSKIGAYFYVNSHFSGYLQYLYQRLDVNIPFDTLDGIYKYNFSIRHDKVKVQIGTVTSIVGRGLVYHNGEDELAELDRFTKGIQFELSPFNNYFTIKGIWGEPVSYVFFKRENMDRRDRISLLNLESNLTRFTGGAYLGRLNTKIIFLPDTSFHTDISGMYLGLNFRNIWIYYEFGYLKGFSKEFFKDTSGFSHFASMDCLFGPFSLSLEFKDSKVFKTPYSQPPTLNKMGVYLNNGLDERGYAFELKVSPLRWNIEIHRSVVKGKNFFSPGWIDQWVFNAKRALKKADINLFYDLVWLKNAFSAGEDFERREYKPQINFSYELIEGVGVSLNFSRRTRNNPILSYKYHDNDFYITLNYKNLLNLTGVYERRTGDSLNVWRRVESNFEINKNLNVEIVYGKQRKDFVCSGGICRFEPEFSGFRGRIYLRF